VALYLIRKEGGNRRNAEKHVDFIYVCKRRRGGSFSRKIFRERRKRKVYSNLHQRGGSTERGGGKGIKFQGGGYPATAREREERVSLKRKSGRNGFEASSSPGGGGWKKNVFHRRKLHSKRMTLPPGIGFCNKKDGGQGLVISVDGKGRGLAKSFEEGAHGRKREKRRQEYPS